MAINGYDPEAYFAQNKAVQGSHEFSINWKNVKWLFGNKQHADLFNKLKSGNSVFISK